MQCLPYEKHIFPNGGLMRVMMIYHGRIRKKIIQQNQIQVFWWWNQLDNEPNPHLKKWVDKITKTPFILFTYIFAINSHTIHVLPLIFMVN